VTSIGWASGGGADATFLRWPKAAIDTKRMAAIAARWKEFVIIYFLRSISTSLKNSGIPTQVRKIR
jgi:hypothetical protein